MVAVSPPVNFEVATIAFHSGWAILEQKLSETVILRTASVDVGARANLYGMVVSCICILVFCARIYKMEPVFGSRQLKVAEMDRRAGKK